jgi:hypothetical protein
MNIFKAFLEFYEGIFDQLLATSGQILQQTSNYDFLLYGQVIHDA